MHFTRAWIPNSLTMGNLLCGFLAAVLATQNDVPYTSAAGLLFIASWLDIFDGGIARKLGVHSPFGTALDSLADVVTFAVAPALLIYRFSLHQIGGWGVLATAFLVCCGVSRVARYITQVSHEKRGHFWGMPLGISTVFASSIVYTLGQDNVWLAALLVVGVGCLMVSTVPFPTPGQIFFDAPIAVRILLAAIWFFGMLRFETWILMPLSYFVYGILQNLVPVLRPSSMKPSIKQGFSV